MRTLRTLSQRYLTPTDSTCILHSHRVCLVRIWRRLDWIALWKDYCLSLSPICLRHESMSRIQRTEVKELKVVRSCWILDHRRSNCFSSEWCMVRQRSLQNKKLCFSFVSHFISKEDKDFFTRSVRVSVVTPEQCCRVENRCECSSWTSKEYLQEFNLPFRVGKNWKRLTTNKRLSHLFRV